MPITTEENKYERVDEGLYRAVYTSVGEEMKVFNWSPVPRVMLTFELADVGQANYSAALDWETVHVIHILTGTDISGGKTPEDLHALAGRALVGCQWKGLVRVGPFGFINQVNQIEAGNVALRFLAFTVREDGKPVIYVTKTGNRRTRVLLEHIGTGQQHIEDIPAKWSYIESGLNVDPRSAMFALLTRGGCTTQDFAGMDFVRGENPMLAFEKVLQDKAAQGHYYEGTISQEGRFKFDPSTLVGKQGEPPQAKPEKNAAPPSVSMTAKVTELLGNIARTMTGDETQVVDAKGNLTGDGGKVDGMYMAKYLLGPIADTLEWSGVQRNWPPKGWGEKGVANCAEVLVHLVNKDMGELMLLIGSSNECAVQLEEELIENFPKLTEKKIEDSIPF